MVEFKYIVYNLINIIRGYFFLIVKCDGFNVFPWSDDWNSRLKYSKVNEQIESTYAIDQDCIISIKSLMYILISLFKQM